MRPVDLTAFIEHLAHQSGEAILPFFRTSLGIQDKGKSQNGEKAGVFDPVTEADRSAETVIRRLIQDSFPSHGILGEEFGNHNIEAEFVWVIDPIDGTRAFICGLPVWGTLIGLMRNGIPVLGVMHQPYTGELFFGDSRAAHIKGPRGTRPIAASTCRTLADAKLMTTDARLFKGGELNAYAKIEAAVKLTRYGADCYAYAMLAAGQVDLVVETGLKPYDIVALIPIIEGAGGVITDWEGNPCPQGGRILAAANPVLHKEALTVLQSSL